MEFRPGGRLLQPASLSRRVHQECPVRENYDEWKEPSPRSSPPHSNDPEHQERAEVGDQLGSALFLPEEHRMVECVDQRRGRIDPEPATTSQVPAAVLREALPPNPYDRE